MYGKLLDSIRQVGGADPQGSPLEDALCDIAGAIELGGNKLTRVDHMLLSLVHILDLRAAVESGKEDMFFEAIARIAKRLIAVSDQTAYDIQRFEFDRIHSEAEDDE